MSGAPGPLRAAYAAALDHHLRDPGEASLHAAYELARDAMGRGVSVLDLAVAHQEALLRELAAVGDGPAAARVAGAAGDFFLEALATYDMVQRGVTEVRERAVEGRRRTALGRRLSAFLADASLAGGTDEALPEVLQLVAEQARELVGAECAVATVDLGGVPGGLRSASYPDDDRRWSAFVRWLDVRGTEELIRDRGPLRAAGAELAGLGPLRPAAGEPPLSGWLAAPLTALDGSAIGALQVFVRERAPFGADDEATLVHLAQLASAAVERTRLYPHP